jgi:Protein of unknown function (DUF2845)
MTDSAADEHRRSMRGVTVFVVLLLGAFSTAHADAMRCGNKLVTFGDTRSAVRSICGEPTDIQTRSILRRPTYDLHGRTIYFGDGYVEIPVEIWIYNFGPYKLMRQVRFVDGRVDEIETIGYGYRDKE